jgi:dihydroneopterin aldolase
MGTIEIEGMEFYAYHGCFAEEQIVGNKFMVDLRLEANCAKAKISDNINDAVNYQTAYEIVKTEIEQKSHLLENIAYRILEKLFQNLDGIDVATVKIAKINPPLGGKIKNVNVVLTKSNTDIQ